MQELPIFKTVHRKQESYENGYPACMGGIYGKDGGHPSHHRNKRNLSAEKGNHRKSLCRCERETRNEIYAIQGISKSQNGAEPPVRLHEFKKNGKLEMETQNRATLLSQVLLF